jgi:cytochrome c5
MHRLALRSLVLAATALLLTTAACDSGQPKADAGKKADAGAADAAKADDGAAEGDKADGAAADAGDAADAGADTTATAGATADAGETTGAEGDESDDGGETGEPIPAAGEEGGDAPPPVDDKKPATDKTEKKPAADKTPAVAKIDGKPLFETKCKSCHGLDGKGDTTIGKKVDIPSLVKTKLGKAKIVTLVTNGVADTKMKAFKDKLSKEEIDAVSDYVKKL